MAVCTSVVELWPGVADFCEPPWRSFGALFPLEWRLDFVVAAAVLMYESWETYHVSSHPSQVTWWDLLFKEIGWVYRLEEESTCFSTPLPCSWWNPASLSVQAVKTAPETDLTRKRKTVVLSFACGDSSPILNCRENLSLWRGTSNTANLIGDTRCTDRRMRLQSHGSLSMETRQNYFAEEIKK